MTKIDCVFFPHGKFHLVSKMMDIAQAHLEFEMCHPFRRSFKFVSYKMGMSVLRIIVYCVLVYV